MKVFVTGASGHIGSTIVPRLLAAGYNVTALARSQSSADKLSALGVTPVRGDLTTLDVLASSAADADAVIHLAFNHEIMAHGDWVTAGKQDMAAINAIGDAVKGTNKTFMVASGTLGIDGPDELAGRTGNHPRQSESNLFAFTSQGVRTLALRLAPVVHSSRDEHLFILGIIDYAKENGFVPYVGEGTNLWSAVHADDAADLAVLALQPDTAPAGSNLHVIDEEGIPVKEIAEFIGAKLGLETKSLTPAEASKAKGFVGMVLGLGRKATNKLTKEWTGWDPKGAKLFEDLDGYSALKK